MSDLKNLYIIQIFYFKCLYIYIISMKKTCNIERSKTPLKLKTISKTISKTIGVDIVIVAHSKDKETLLLSLDRIGKCISGIKNIYLVAKNNFIGKGVIFVDENTYPFSQKDVITILEKLGCSDFKYGWFYQQLLKLYAFKIIPKLTEYFLVFDADLIFLNNFPVFDKTGKPYFTTSNENHKYYFEHISRLIPGLTKQTKFSGISNHMIFCKSILEQLFKTIEAIHKVDMWRAFLSYIIFNKRANYSCASEYEIYFNYALKYYNKYYVTRELKWCNTPSRNLEEYRRKGYVYICLHDYFVHDYTKYKIE